MDIYTTMTYICIRPDLFAIYFTGCVRGANNTDGLIFILGEREVM